jgi:hypothetical protein
VCVMRLVCRPGVSMKILKRDMEQMALAVDSKAMLST